MHLFCLKFLLNFLFLWDRDFCFQFFRLSLLLFRGVFTRPLFSDSFSSRYAWDLALIICLLFLLFLLCETLQCTTQNWFSCLLNHCSFRSHAYVPFSLHPRDLHTLNYLFSPFPFHSLSFTSIPCASFCISDNLLTVYVFFISLPDDLQHVFDIKHRFSSLTLLEFGNNFTIALPAQNSNFIVILCPSLALSPPTASPS